MDYQSKKEYPVKGYFFFLVKRVVINKLKIIKEGRKDL